MHSAPVVLLSEANSHSWIRRRESIAHINAANSLSSGVPPAHRATHSTKDDTSPSLNRSLTLSCPRNNVPVCMRSPTCWCCSDTRGTDAKDWRGNRVDDVQEEQGPRRTREIGRELSWA